MVSEIIPKTIGAYYWKELSTLSARVIQVLVWVTYPLLVVMQKITNIISKDKRANSNITIEEIEATVMLGEKAGVLKEKDSHIIENLLLLNDIKVKDIHTPRKVMFSLNKDQFLDTLTHKDMSSVDIAKLKIHSRVPVWDKNIDDIIGIIFTKEYLYEYIYNEKNDKLDLIKPVFRIHENIPVSKLLDIFLSKKEHLFIVEDSYGQTEGIVTLEDALETLLGREIVDEHDRNINMRELAKRKFRNAITQH